MDLPSISLNGRLYIRADLVPRDSVSSEIRATRVVSAVAESYGCEPSMITGRDRSENMLKVRAAAICLMAELAMSWSAIGRSLGNRNHTTVRHAHNKHAGDPWVSGLAEKARAILGKGGFAC